MVTRNQPRFPFLKTAFFMAVIAWAMKNGYEALAAFLKSLISGTTNGEPSAEGSPDAVDEERTERKKRNKKVVIGVLIALALVTAGLAVGAVYTLYLLDNLSPSIAFGLLGGTILINAAIAAVHRHTSLPGSIAFAVASSLSSALFGLVTTYVFGQSMAFPVLGLGLEWNYVLLLSSIGTWILAINYTLWRIKALSIGTALTITIALLLLAIPAVNFLYFDLDWQDPIATFSQGFAKVEALQISKNLSWLRGNSYVA